MKNRWWPYVLGVLVCAFLLVLFPRAFALAELMARELMYFWWVILLLALSFFLIWGFGRNGKNEKRKS